MKKCILLFNQISYVLNLVLITNTFFKLLIAASLRSKYTYI